MKGDNIAGKEERIRRRDNRLLKNEKSWRRARIGAIGLAILSIFTLVLLKHMELMSQEELKEEFYASLASVLFWLLIVSWLNMRIWHIESIKLYRKQINGEMVDSEGIIYSKRVKEEAGNE
jgi:hypothetical protein